MFCRLLTLTIVMALTMPVAARLTFTQRLQQKAGVRLYQDKTIDLLVNGREPDAADVTTTQGNHTPVALSSESKVKTQTKPATQPTQSAKAEPNKPADESPTQTTTTTASAYTTAQGYRVKVYMGGSTREDKETAQNVGKEFKRLFPNVPVYMHFVSPHWICTAGDFISKAEAQTFIQEIRESGRYSTQGMTVVKSRVKVPVK